MNRYKVIIKNFLLAFVLISIGFILGKNFTSQNATCGVIRQNDVSFRSGDFVDVYYFHSTFRCSTCNKIEALTENLLKSEFSKELNNNKIVFTEVNFQENEKLAEKYGVVASCVVIALKQNGKILRFRRLDEVWTLIGDPNKFKEYISNVIKGFLKEVN